MTQPAHSKLGASTAKRWMSCPGSVKLCEGLPNRSSAYADEGTKAHDLAAKVLEGEMRLRDLPDELREPVGEYVNAVMKHAAHGVEILVEHRFDLSQVHPGCFGTADAVVYKPEEKRLIVIDYKHGAGVPVEVERNPQLLYYALGALLSTGSPCKVVESVIVQPRCFHPDGPVRSWEYSPLELIDFASDVAKLAILTEKPDAPLVPGEHCRFCNAAGICPKLKEKALTVAKTEFSPQLSYDPVALGAALEMLSMIEGWCKNVREFAYAELAQGKHVPGWKLVQKRPTRRWANESQVEEFLELRANLDKSLSHEAPSLKSPAQIEKLLAKKLKDELQEHIVSESSGFALAHESDKRPAVKQLAAEQFTALE